MYIYKYLINKCVHVCVHVRACVRARSQAPKKCKGEMAIPSCQPDPQVSRCTSAWPAVKLGANKVLFKNKG